jgi:hypothetical protein
LVSEKLDLLGFDRFDGDCIVPPRLGKYLGVFLVKREVILLMMEAVVEALVSISIKFRVLSG